jgi:hypothetical protein
LAPWAWSASSRSCASRSRFAALSGSAGGLPARLALLLLLGGRGGLGGQLVDGAPERALDELAVEGPVDDDRPAALELDQHARGSGLVDVGLVEADRRRAVGVAVELLVQPFRFGELRRGPLAQPQVGDLVPAGTVKVGGERLAVAVAERGVQHPAGLARQPLGGPLVAVVDERDHRLEQLRRHGADRPQLVDGAQRDGAGADKLLGALGQLEHLYARGHARLRPAKRLGGPVLGQAAGEHRLDRAGLLVGVELLARDVLNRAVGVLGLRLA